MSPKRTKISIMKDKHPQKTTFRNRATGRSSGLSSLENLDRRLTESLDHREGAITKIGLEVRALAVDALAVACRFRETDQNEVTAIALSLDESDE